MDKGVFLVLFWVLVVLFFLVSLCLCASVLYTIAWNGYFPAFLEFIFFLFCFFCFCLPFQKSIFFFAFLSINPFLEKTLSVVSFVFLLLAFFLLVCLKQTFLTSPFKPKLFSLLAVYFFLLSFLFLFSWCMFQPFCFYVGFVFGILLFFICVFAFVLLRVLISVYEKKCFPCNSGVFKLCCLKG